MGRASRLSVMILAATLAVLLAAPATGAPDAPAFGPHIEPPAPYDGQSRCTPKAKPGVRRFAKLLEKSYGEAWMGIGRKCSIGGQSEHKEGRALDWSMNASRAADRAKVDDLFAWLFAPDAFGNENAIARRLGLMYVIWNRQMWSSWTGAWEVLCVPKDGTCVDPEDGHPVHPHRDHVHFSFTWEGARARTSYFTPERSMVMDIAADAATGGYVVAAGNGSVNGSGPLALRARRAKPRRQVVAGMALRPGGGYWLVLRSGRVSAHGGAPALGSVARKRGRISGIEATPTGGGYWLVGRSGRVDAFGDALALGGANRAKVVAIASTPTGGGYWLFSATGEVRAYGDAVHHGDLAGTADPVVGGAAHPGGGYWLVTSGGPIAAFGGAPVLGDAPEVAPVAGIAPTADGGGYWVAGRMGAVVLRGTAGAPPSEEPA